MQFNSRCIEFELSGVPESWANKFVWSRQAALGIAFKKKVWTRNTAAWGLTKRLKADWKRAEKDHGTRLVTIHQLRHGELDDDNLFSSIKPILDGCKVYVKQGRKPIYGAGLIWDDNPKHCRLIISQERVGFSIPCKTIIKVERFDTSQN